MRKWQAKLGLQAWKIRLTRQPEVIPNGYPGTEEGEEGFNAGYCRCDPHRMVATIYVATDAELAKHRIPPEEVLVHELLHLRLGQLIMVPPKESHGQTLLLENAIHSLTRALLGTHRASPRGKGDER